MNESKRTILLFVICVVSSRGKTIRSQIRTNEDGTKQLIFDESVDQKDIDLMTDDLKLASVADDNRIDDAAVSREEKPIEEKSTGKKENILMKHWNSLTEVGWKQFGESAVNGDGADIKESKFRYQVRNTGEGVKEAKPSHAESHEDKPQVDEPSSTDLHEFIQPDTSDQKHSTTESTQIALSSPDLPKGKNETVEGQRRTFRRSSRTFLRPRRLLHKILLPLLVLIVIKYLVTLPFVAVSAFTLNSMWLGLLSLAAVFFSKFKSQDKIYHKYPARRINHIHGTELYEPREPFPPTELIWSPIRVPITPPTIESFAHQ
ncbi:hypothetical protein RUM43_013212 [Polyplax serrata]|uniref:Uncharacterized protein n=1 Tax=Polyplax serrata TaxID=468196 RepID=A0AAN8P363_POLSC